MEPYYNFRMIIPTSNVGRAMSDIQQRHGRFYPPESDEDITELTGYVPVSTLGDYQTEINSYTSGMGRIMLTLRGFEPCHNTNEVIANIGYDSDSDFKNPSSSVFCANGAGFSVKWDEVEEYKHVANEWKEEVVEDSRPNLHTGSKTGSKTKSKYETSYRGTLEEDKELESIFERTFGPIERKINTSKDIFGYENKSLNKKPSSNSENDRDNKWKNKKLEKSKETYLLVDGYNIIFAWDDLKDLAEEDLSAARIKLADILSDYQGYKQYNVILVYDAYKVEGGIGKIMDYENIHVVFTKEAETADMYIEKVTNDIARKHTVIVATSDRLEQIIIMGHGAMRLSANELKQEIDLTRVEIRENYMEKQSPKFNRLGDHLNEELDKFRSEE